MQLTDWKGSNCSALVVVTKQRHSMTNVCENQIWNKDFRIACVAGRNFISRAEKSCQEHRTTFKSDYSSFFKNCFKKEAPTGLPLARRPLHEFSPTFLSSFFVLTVSLQEKNSSRPSRSARDNSSGPSGSPDALQSPSRKTHYVNVCRYLHEQYVVLLETKILSDDSCWGRRG